MKYILLVLLTFKCQKLTESQVPRDPLTDWIKNVVTTVVGGDPGSKGLSEIVSLISVTIANSVHFREDLEIRELF